MAAALFACAIAAGLTAQRDLSLPFLGLLALLTILVQTVLALTVNAWRGGCQRLVFYHHAAAFALTVSVAAVACGQAFAVWLNAVIPALFAFQAVGRIGCWAAGCCHGKPSRFGFVYGPTHVEAVARDLLGLPLWPVQLAEAFAAAVAAAAGYGGASFLTCFAIYGGARFFLDGFRGEPGRSRAFGLTEAQWTSAALVALGWWPGVLLLGAVAVLPRPVPAEHVLQLLRAIACTRIERAVATTAFGLVLKREAGELRVMSSVSPRMSRHIYLLEHLCAIRNT